MQARRSQVGRGISCGCRVGSAVIVGYVSAIRVFPGSACDRVAEPLAVFLGMGKDAEISLPGHQIALLERHGAARPKPTWADRADIPWLRDWCCGWPGTTRTGATGGSPGSERAGAIIASDATAGRVDSRSRRLLTVARTQVPPVGPGRARIEWGRLEGVSPRSGSVHTRVYLAPSIAAARSPSARRVRTQRRGRFTAGRRP